MSLGTFSVSLTVKDIKASKEFYEKLNFSIIGGEIEQKWLILKNGDTTIGLFEGMFKKNMLTFNPGWDKDCKTLDSFTDVRDIHKNLHDKGVKTSQVSLDNESGPGSFMVVDPDGNPILIDQHI